MARPLTQVGVIIAAHGVRGQVKLRSFTNPPRAVLDYSPLYNESGSREFRITASGGMDSAMIITFEGLTDRNEAELLKGTVLYADIPHTGTSDDLTGFKAVLADGSEYGTVVAHHDFGAGEIIEIEKPGGKTEMLPCRAPFVSNISKEKSTLVVEPPEYLEGK